VDRDSLRVAVVAALCVLALGAAAATLDSATTTGGGMGPTSSGDAGVDDTEGDDTLPLDDRSGGDFGVGGVCIELLRSPQALAVAVGIAALIAYALRRQYDTMVALAFVFALALPLFIVYILLAGCSTGGGGSLVDGIANFTNSSMPQGGGMLGDEDGRTVPSAPSLLLLALLAGVFLLAVGVVVRGTDDDEEPPQEEFEEDEERAAAVAAAAGRAADRIEADGDLENEVYRAWREMVRLLAVSNPRATTPGEFADAAVAAGIDRDDVRELTGLFEAVRYGGFEATDERERRAVEALRRIEREYGGDE